MYNRLLVWSWKYSLWHSTCSNIFYIAFTLLWIVTNNGQNKELSKMMQKFLQHDKTLRDYVKLSSQQGKINHNKIKFFELQHWVLFNTGTQVESIQQYTHYPYSWHDNSIMFIKDFSSFVHKKFLANHGNDK